MSMDAEPVSAEKVQQALRAQMCAHRAMDAPKHFPAAAVLAPSKEPRVAAGVHARAPRSMKVFLGGVDFHTPGLIHRRTFALFEKELQEQLPGGSAWMPDQVVCWSGILHSFATGATFWPAFAAARMHHRNCVPQYGEFFKEVAVQKGPQRPN